MKLRSRILLTLFVTLLGITTLCPAADLRLTGNIAIRYRATLDLDVVLLLYFENMSDEAVVVPTAGFDAEVTTSDQQININVTIPDKATKSGANVPYSVSELKLVTLEQGEVIGAAIPLTVADAPTQRIAVTVSLDSKKASRYGYVAATLRCDFLPPSLDASQPKTAEEP